MSSADQQPADQRPAAVPASVVPASVVPASGVPALGVPASDVREAATLLRAAERIVVFTGAGVSASSGIPTFRDALTGLWQHFDAEALATPKAFDTDPDLVWGWYEWRRTLVSRVLPSPGHAAIAEIERQAPGCTVITQNIDDLHERSGSSVPLHLHGSLFEPRCSKCSHPAPAATGEHVAVNGTGERLRPPVCVNCGGPVRPGVVWFGEALPDGVFTAAVEAAANCDLLLAVGTSGLVTPAAEIPVVAAEFGASVVQVNPESTPLDAVATINLRGTSDQVLPAVVAEAWS